MSAKPSTRKFASYTTSAESIAMEPIDKVGRTSSLGIRENADPLFCVDARIRDLSHLGPDKVNRFMRISEKQTSLMTGRAE